MKHFILAHYNTALIIIVGMAAWLAIATMIWAIHHAPELEDDQDTPNRDES